MRLLPCSIAAVAFAAIAAGAPLFAAELQDSSPVDVASLLQELKRLREQQATQRKQRRQSALQQVIAAASNGERAASLWEDAVRAVQFEGAAREGTAVKEWRDREGEGLDSKEGREAARLFFAWLGLTLQHDAGAPVKDLLAQVVGYTKELAAHREAMEAVEDSIKKDKELDASGKHGKRRDGDESKVKRMNDQILGKALAGSPVVRWFGLEDFVHPGKWETNPGNYDGIFKQVILPELRAQRDPRLLEYWDMQLRKEAGNASKMKLFDAGKFTRETRPGLLWQRSQDMLLLGQKHRGMAEMFELIKRYPQHPDAESWIASLEALLVPTAAPAVAPKSPFGDPMPPESP